VAVGLASIFFLVRGARWYRLALISPGVIAGGAAGVHLTEGMASEAQLLTICALAIVGGAILHFAERLAIALLGAMVLGGLSQTVAAAWLASEPHWGIPVAGAAVGLVIFPRIYKALLPVITSILGALGLAWALDRPDDLLLIGGLSVAGSLAQIILARRERSDDED